MEVLILDVAVLGIMLGRTGARLLGVCGPGRGGDTSGARHCSSKGTTVDNIPDEASQNSMTKSKIASGILVQDAICKAYLIN